MNKLLSEENKVPEHCLKQERWQGPPHINKVKQDEAVLSSRFSLFIQFIQSWKQRVRLFSLFRRDDFPPD